MIDLFRPARVDRTRALAVCVAEIPLAVLVTQIDAIGEFAGVVWVGSGVVAALWAGTLVGPVAALEGVALGLLFGLPVERPATVLGVAIGFILVTLTSLVVGNAVDRQRAALDRFRELLALTFDAIVLSVDGEIVEVNDGFERLTGIPRREAVGKQLLDFVEPSQLERVREHVASRSTEPLETYAFERDGAPLHLRVTGQNVEFRGRAARLSALSDLTELRRAEAGHADATERYRALFDSAAVAVTIADLDGIYLEVNDVFCSLVGRGHDALVGHHFSEFTWPGEGGEHVLDEILDGEPGPFNFDGAMRHADGRRVPTRVSIAIVRDEGGSPLYSVTIIDSMEEQRRLEHQVQQRQKMEAIGQLAGGIAHDFNNLLTVIGGNAMLLNMGELSDDAREHVDQITAAAERASALTRQLLTFSRAREPKLDLVDINAVIGSVEGMLRRLIGENVRIETELADDLAPVRADPVQLEQVLINLALNARDAMPGGGRLRIGTAASEEGVALEVADDGVGMDDETRERIFEPFFTTKPAGEGTGLGLANVYGIVVQAGGEIHVVSAPGEGTTFTIDLPAADTPKPRRRPGEAVPPGSKTGRILFVDDEAAVRRIAGTTLKRAGHDLVLAASGDQALDLLHAGERIDLLVTDLSMPGMTGVELANRVRAIAPEIGVLFVSGFADRHFGPGERDGADVLEKPFTPSALAARVQRALSASATSGTNAEAR
jgi:two-component system cell cycle sensor histidine kinase/response regulator CckA